MEIPRPKYPSLNGLRAISIILVVLFHLYSWRYSITSFLNPIETGQKNIIKKFLLRFIQIFFTSGDLGVNIFFVISGFLITSLLLVEEKNTSTVALKKFYYRRFLRIFPAYYFLLFCYFILQLLGIIYIPKTFWIMALTYTKCLNVGGTNWSDWYVAHTWSLSVEEWFYLIWPWAFLCGKTWRKFFSFFTIIAVGVLRFYSSKPQLNGIITGNAFFRRADALAIGCLAALYKDELLKIFSSYWKILISISIPLLIFSYYLPLGGEIGIITNVFIVILMMYSVFGPQNTIWFRCLNSKPMNYIGILSYSIYIYGKNFSYQIVVIGFQNFLKTCYSFLQWHYFPIMLLKNLFLSSRESLSCKNRIISNKYLIRQYINLLQNK